MKDKTCVNCGKPFRPHHAREQICDDCCESIAARKKNPQYGICPTCGKHFQPRNANQVHCSSRCLELSYLMTQRHNRRLRRELTIGRQETEDKKPKQRRSHKVNAELDELCRKAKEAGLSYGQYMGRIIDKRRRANEQRTQGC